MTLDAVGMNTPPLPNCWTKPGPISQIAMIQSSIVPVSCWASAVVADRVAIPVADLPPLVAEHPARSRQQRTMEVAAAVARP
jgi:hypothetical protein